MGILEDLLLNARTAVDAVGKKAGKVIDVSKLTLAAADLKSEISRKCEILGRITYEAKTTGKNYDKTIDELVEKIKDLNSQLDSVNDVIANSKQKQKCSVCGTYNAKGAVFCNKCGERLNAKTDADEPADTTSSADNIDFAEDSFDDGEIGL
ncbi:MAG: zinc ribbon domain-containing protein [Clostridia bacterium]|nr:zinc ribbon domain-containing protein [Clostridia bacterium]